MTSSPVEQNVDIKNKFDPSFPNICADSFSQPNGRMMVLYWMLEFDFLLF